MFKKQGSSPDSGAESKGLDMLLKLGPAIASVIAVIGAALIANSYQSKMSATTLISQREQAESQLRASMFKDLVGAIMQTTSGRQSTAEIDTVHEQLLVELLTLNFDGQFEFKPLLLHLDNELAGAAPKGGQRERRESLRSISRRVISRQIARLFNAGAKGDMARVDRLIVVDTPRSEEQEKEFEKTKSYYGELSREYPESSIYYGQLQQEMKISSPDKKHVLGVTIKDCNWENQTCDVLTTVNRGTGATEEGQDGNALPFSLTWFDFPLTDNTLLADGNRFALSFDSVDPDRRAVALKLIWFPKAYFTPRERPMNFTVISNKLGFKPGD
jgi:hypothetical protein